ncbi:uracil phosphoribosyltransferase [Lentzea sp. NEAU-D7]|jgi:uracil phosphoribosyltransferase|uniref:uracil phosphoribosyltransferase n=1 Tax=Lentzea sp. NEAU-D7 TaxID=2994667 RepID=UPI00224AFF4E|nr:uracil phosphoribosyltransferase [Lentzea sp. NEAU-D7]MCX2952789.1 uracil phosphoribosyltransferase [Lentzea sp. NEAU-D7]QOJ56163.1 Uracil phosphoribosyltransferase [Streptomyces candidus]USF91798.1 uracil phosphoribosyltransferase [Streptomyces candidus]
MTATAETPVLPAHLRENVHLLPQTPLLRALHTIIRDRDVPRDQFVFHADRIIRMLLDAALDLLPFEPHQVRTPVGHVYEGLRFAERVCGVSVVRAGESMEAGLRAVLPPVRIGKILIQRDKETVQPHLYYTKLPADIAERNVLLLDPMLATAGTARMAVQVLLDHGVPEERIVFVNLLTAPEGIAALCDAHPRLRLVTSSIEQRLNENSYMLPGIGDFGDRYFGTDR